MAGSGRFTFVMSEREVSLLLEALEVQGRVASPSGKFRDSDFVELAAFLEERTSW